MRFLTCLLILVHVSAASQIEALKNDIEQLGITKKATIGVAIHGFENNEVLSINGDMHFPMQSVFKLHIALTVLNQADKGKFALDQEIFITKKELLPNTWSPLREDYPEGNVRLSLDKLLGYMVSQSDNNVCDILLRQLGGTHVVRDYIHSIGINAFSIQANEEEMAKEWEVQFKNWTTAKASTDLLKLIYQRKILSQKSFDFLWQIMIETSTGPDRLKKQLPANTQIAHKTGTSGKNKDGIMAVVNDVGIIKLPNGKKIAISVFVCNSSENLETNEKIIADIAKLTADYFSK